MTDFPRFRFSRLMLLILLAVTLSGTIFSLIDGWKRAHYRQQLDYAEGDVLNAGVLITHGEMPYASRPWPVVINPYGPVSYYLVAIPVYLEGVSFAGPRVLILGCCILSGFFIALITYDFARSRLIAALAATMFLSHSLVRYWNAVLRVDFIGLVFTLAGLWVFIRFPRKWVLAVLLFTAAIFVKPTLLAAPAACVLSLIVKREFRRAIAIAVTGSVLIAAGLVVMQAATHGGFWFNMFDTHPDPWTFSHYRLMFHYFVLGDPLLIAIAAVAFASALWQKRFDVLTLYVACSLLTTVSAGKLGSNDNHLLELIGALSICSSTALATWFLGKPAVRFAASIASILLATLVALQLRYAPTTQPQPGCNSVYDLVQQMPSDRILSEDVGALVVAHKTVWVSDPFVYGQLVSAGRLSDKPLADRIRTEWFDLIVLSETAEHATERWSPDLATDIREHYHLLGRYACEGAKAAYVPNER